jgi:hypothetical protein
VTAPGLVSTFAPAVSLPAIPLPPAACGAHAQVFGPFDRLLDLSRDSVGDAGLVRRVLVDSPAALYGFAENGCSEGRRRC